MKSKKKNKEFNDLLIPIILIIMILPLITRLIRYDCGLSVYPWYQSDGIATDYFTYYKSIFFMMISFLSGIVLLIYMFLHKNELKGMKPFLLLCIYGLCALVSTIFSINQQISIVGGIALFENIFVLLGYVIIILYTYQIEKVEHDYIIIGKAIVISLFCMIVIGLFQMIGKDLLEFHLFQKMFIPRQYQGEYLGKIKSILSNNAVSLTLFNPNYASVYLTMMISFLVAIIPRRERKEKLLFIGILCILIILLFKTYSRTGLVSLSVPLLLFAYLYRYQLKSYWKQVLVLFFFVLLLFVGTDALNDFRYSKKISATLDTFSNSNQNTLQKITTGKDAIYINYRGDELFVAYSDLATATSLSFSNAKGENITSYYDSKSEVVGIKPFDELQFKIEEIVGEQTIVANINDITWRFYYSKSKGYQYVNEFGNLDTLNEIPRYGFKNYEKIGSGRGYIWSRSLPLIKSTLLIGTGPDTFSVAFPQSDYVGKANNCKTPYTLIEKAHNLYLMTGIQTGLVSLIAVVCFYLFYFIPSIRIYNKRSIMLFTEQFGLGCFLATVSFMVAGLFNDSSLQTTPIFCVFLGLGMDINYTIVKGLNMGLKK